MPSSMDPSEFERLAKRFRWSTKRERFLLRLMMLILIGLMLFMLFRSDDTESFHAAYLTFLSAFIVVFFAELRLSTIEPLLAEVIRLRRVVMRLEESSGSRSPQGESDSAQP